MRRAAAVRDYGGVSADDRRADRRRKLLAGGRRIWGESGIGELSVRGVCAAAGLGPRYFYEQFRDRDDLVLAVADELRDELIAALLTAGLGEPGDLAAKLRAALKAFLHIIADDPHVHRIFTDILSGSGELGERRRQALDTVTELVIEHGPGTLDFEPPSPNVMRRGAVFIVGGVNQLIDSWVHDPQLSTDDLADACTELCVAVVATYARPNRLG